MGNGRTQGKANPKLVNEVLRAGTLASILGDVARHVEMSRDELLKRLFG